MEYRSTAEVPTRNGARYMRQLCSRWAHSLAVEVAEASASVIFPRDARGADWPGDARLEMLAGADRLECRLTASDAAQLAALQGTVARHLDRFAFREAPLAFDWRE